MLRDQAPSFTGEMARPTRFEHMAFALGGNCGVQMLLFLAALRLPLRAAGHPGGGRDVVAPDWA